MRDGTIRIGFSNKYFKGDRYTLSVYFPIYDLNTIMMERGLLCMNFTKSGCLEQILEDRSGNGRQTAVVQTDGTIIADHDLDSIGETVSYKEKLVGSEGEFSWEGRLYIYQKVSDWNYYIVSSIENMELYAPSVRTIIIMTAILFFMVILSFFVIKRYHKPGIPASGSNCSENGSGSGRVFGYPAECRKYGEDFQKLATGFNSMMEEILVLMNR